MAEARHGRLTTSEGIHIRYQWAYANQGAREGASGFIASDVGKFCRQLDNNSLWMLTAVTPTWIEVGTGAGAGDTGIQGDTGEAGDTGVQGDTGLGDTGLQGETGVHGDTGLAGET